MTKKVLLSILSVVMVSVLQAMPGAQKASRLLTLDDGSEVYAELKGNHVCHYWQTEDGRCFVALGNGKYVEQPRQELAEKPAGPAFLFDGGHGMYLRKMSKNIQMRNKL